MMTADEMRAIVARHVNTNEFDVKEDPNPEAHADRGAPLDLLREVAERVRPRRGLLANECPLCGVMGSDAHQRHLSDCPAPVLEVLRG